MNYYNEFDPKASSALKQLISDRLIPFGHVDTRSITDVRASDLTGYTQCHFFAGIGGWSYALQLAGWGATRPVWTGSCPCQPFSTAGKRKGKEDDRHLWPVWFNLIRECRPPVIFGEQVAGAIAHGWFDEVHQGLESEGYACGAAVLPACGVGAPHKRDRLWFVAYAKSARSGGAERPSCETSGRSTTGNGMQSGGTSAQCCPLGNTEHYGSFGGTQLRGNETASQERRQERQDVPRQFAGTSKPDNVPSVSGSDGRERENTCDVADTENINSNERRCSDNNNPWRSSQGEIGTDGCVFIDCPDGKQRLTQPGICLLAHGFSERVGLLRAAGNAIVPQVAAEFIKAYKECE